MSAIVDVQGFLSVLPADAGVIPNGSKSSCVLPSAPRRCGGDPGDSVEVVDGVPCSPQMRG